MSDMVIVTKNEYDMLKINANSSNVTISRSEYDCLKNGTITLDLVCRILRKKEFCEDELRMILGIERRENETSDCDSERVESSKEQI